MKCCSYLKTLKIAIFVETLDMKPKNPLLKNVVSVKSPVGKKAPVGIVRKTIPKIAKKK